MLFCDDDNLCNIADTPSKLEQYCLEANYNQDRNMDENQSPMSEGSGDKSRTKMVDILCTF